MRSTHVCIKMEPKTHIKHHQHKRRIEQRAALTKNTLSRVYVRSIDVFAPKLFNSPYTLYVNTRGVCVSLSHHFF